MDYMELLNSFTSILGYMFVGIFIKVVGFVISIKIYQLFNKWNSTDEERSERDLDIVFTEADLQCEKQHDEMNLFTEEESGKMEVIIRHKSEHGVKKDANKTSNPTNKKKKEQKFDNDIVEALRATSPITKIPGEPKKCARRRWEAHVKFMVSPNEVVIDRNKIGVEVDRASGKYLKLT